MHALKAIVVSYFEARTIIENLSCCHEIGDGTDPTVLPSAEDLVSISNRRNHLERLNTASAHTLNQMDQTAGFPAYLAQAFGSPHAG